MIKRKNPDFEIASVWPFKLPPMGLQINGNGKFFFFGSYQVCYTPIPILDPTMLINNVMGKRSAVFPWIVEIEQGLFII